MKDFIFIGFAFLIVLSGCKKKEIEKFELSKITQYLPEINREVSLFEFERTPRLSKIKTYDGNIASPGGGSIARLAELNYQNNKLVNVIRYAGYGHLKTSFNYNSKGFIAEAITDAFNDDNKITMSLSSIFNYDSAGQLQLVSKDYASYSLQFDYDNQGNLIKTTVNNGDKVTVYEISFAQHKNPLYGIPLTYIYDNIGIWDLISLSKNQITSMKYKEYENGVLQTDSDLKFDCIYDNLGRPVQIKQYRGKNNLAYEAEYRYYH